MLSPTIPKTKRVPKHDRLWWADAYLLKFALNIPHFDTFWWATGMLQKHTKLYNYQNALYNNTNIKINIYKYHLIWSVVLLVWFMMMIFILLLFVISSLLHCIYYIYTIVCFYIVTMYISMCSNSKTCCLCLLCVVYVMVTVLYVIIVNILKHTQKVETSKIAYFAHMLMCKK